MYIPTLGRRRLIDVVLTADRLSVLHAGSGWGKTALLRECYAEARARNLVPVWVSLDGRPNDSLLEYPEALWAELAEATLRAWGPRTAPPQGVNAANDLARASSSQEATRALATLMRADENLVLVIDALDQVTSGLADVWATLIDVMRDNPCARIAVATRTLAGLPNEMLVSNVHLSIMTERALSFSARETADLITATFPEAVILGAPSGSIQAGELSPLPHARQHAFPSLLALATHIVAETDGHVASVVTGLHASSRHTEVQSIDWRAVRLRHAADALARLDCQGVLEATTWLPYFDVDLASELSGRSTDEIAATLTVIERHGFGSWRPAHDGHLVFAYAPGVREASDHVPSRGSGQAETAITWLAERGSFTDALVLALQARALHRANDLYRRMLITHPYSFTPEFDAALREVTPAELHHHPTLAVARGVALLSNPLTRDVAVVFLAPLTERDPVALRRASLEEELLELTTQSVVLRLLGRTRDSATVALEGSRRIASAGWDEAVDPALFTPLVCQLSQSLFEAGHVGASQRLVARGSATVPLGHLHFWGLYGRAWYGLDGRVPAAEEMTTLIAASSEAPPPDGLGVAWGARTRTLERIGEAALLLDRWEFDRAIERVVDVRGARWGTSSTWGAWVRLHASLGLGTHAREAVHVQAALESAPARPSSLGHSALINVLSIAWLMSGNVVRARRAHSSATEYPGQTAPAHALLMASASGPEQALASLPDLRNAAGHTVRSRAGLETVGAALALRAGADDVAVALLEQAAALHTEHASRAHLLYLAESDRAGLHTVASGLGSEPVNRFLDGLDATAPLVESLKHVPLSRRELAVLKALAGTRSRLGIAVALHVSENTVKTQLSSIYRKLEVTNRDDAIRRAVELDLLGDNPFYV